MYNETKNNVVEGGQVKLFMDTISIVDGEIGDVVIQCLKERGFDLVVRPIRNNENMRIGRTVEIYRRQR